MIVTYRSELHTSLVDTFMMYLQTKFHIAITTFHHLSLTSITVNTDFT